MTQRRAVVALAVAAPTLVLLAASFVPFLRPDLGDPVRADAVVVLSGDPGERLVRAMELLNRGVTSILVLDGTPDSVPSLQLCRGGQSFEVVCLRPVPDNTREEARAAAGLAASRGWKRIIVSTSDYHVTRSALLFRRCVDGEVVMVAGESPYAGRRLAKATVREWLGVARALTVARGC